MNKAKILKHTANYHDELISSLKNTDEANAYLRIALEEYQEDNDKEAFLIALRNIVEARGGIGELARKTDLSRQNLYHVLSKKGNPTLFTFSLILKDLGYRLSIQPNNIKKAANEGAVVRKNKISAKGNVK